MQCEVDILRQNDNRFGYLTSLWMYKYSNAIVQHSSLYETVNLSILFITFETRSEKKIDQSLQLSPTNDFVTIVISLGCIFSRLQNQNFKICHFWRHVCIKWPWTLVTVLPKYDNNVRKRSIESEAAVLIPSSLFPVKNKGERPIHSFYWLGTVLLKSNFH